MIKKYQHLGTPLTQSDMKEIKGGNAMAGRQKYKCLIPDVPGWWIICYNGDPVAGGCASYCELPHDVCPAGPNECV